MKQCIKCLEEKELTDFVSKVPVDQRREKDYGNICRLCYNEYHRKYYNKNGNKKYYTKLATYRKNVIKELKLKHGCCICGYKKCARALHFHHLDASIKSFEISKLGTKNPDRIVEELGKCVILCSNCHYEVEDGLCSKDLSNHVIMVDSTMFISYKPESNVAYNKQCKCGADIHVNSTQCVKCKNISLEKLTLTKEELYELIWQKPLSHVAKDLGIAQNTLRHRCKKFNLPIPPVGYWNNYSQVECPNCGKIGNPAGMKRHHFDNCTYNKEKFCDCGEAIHRTSVKCRRCVGEESRKFKITKEELEKIIWEKPITHIAKSYGVSDNAIIKRCKTWNIKKPPRGYWLKNNE